jgi:hypothetical protein
LNKSGEVHHHKDYLTCIGYCASGFRLKDDCNINTNSNSDLGWNGYWELPQNIKPYTSEARTYLAGSYRFKVCEMEVYKIEYIE